MTDDPLLAVRDLKKHYPVRSGLLRRVTGQVKAVDGISFEVREGETVGLVGESGCGKSTTATSVLRLEEPTAGDVYFEGDDITAYDDDEQKRFRRRAQMVFQDPNSAFDPRMTVGESVAEPLAIHGLRDDDRQAEIVSDILERVGLSADDADRYPHEFSGGQKQRIALARALILNPDLLVADEPVSALDVSVQAEILSLLDDLQSELGLSMLLISHDLGVVREVCDRVGVMYLGEMVEVAPTEELFANPQHPYTEALLASIPEPDPRSRGEAVELTGDVPDPSNPPSGCSFHTRCPRVVPPEDFEFPDGSFRQVLDFRLAAENGDVDTDALAGDTALREEFGLPSSLPDPDAESVLAAAISDAASGDVEAAADRLADAFPTVCERTDPELVDTEAGHPAACHLHDAASEHAPPELTNPQD
ncbi:ABC transporter ATP-binding protein [Halobacterium bonnevillei]|uniref:ATP-binding cassette domain-containing protein n=1 Tax=Halobacterium bonnevillei TaxID=2692200 RepID=A0A6B0SP36_9EURY|nr:ABC transporter ATP-binding protein [Halobacterium bonnevillei]MXR20752.1 ATP-binding cassette domain-containing protein [Halobacterium bonnevillei]